MEQPSPTPYRCPFCQAGLQRFPSGYSEYELACEGCEAGFSIDEATGEVRSRRWDRQAARGVHQTFKLADLEGNR
jgi:hypothetical protein